MKDHIVVDLTEVAAAINRLRATNAPEAYTADIIREYMGGFFSNGGVAVHLSWNAQFGRLISRNAEMLGIQELKPDQKVADDLMRETTSSLWKI